MKTVYFKGHQSWSPSPLNNLISINILHRILKWQHTELILTATKSTVKINQNETVLFSFHLDKGLYI